MIVVYDPTTVFDLVSVRVYMHSTERTSDHFCTMELVCAPCSNERDATRLEVRAKLALLDEMLLLALRRVELQGKWVATEVVQRVAEA